MQLNQARDRILGVIAPVVGENMARSAVLAQAQKLGIAEGAVTGDQLSALIEKIGQGLNVFVGRERSQQLVVQMRGTVGAEGEAGR